MTDTRKLEALLQRIADALDRLAPPPPPANDLDGADAFVWHAERGWLEPVPTVNRVELDLLQGIDRVRDILLENTRRFAAGLAGQQRAAVGRARHGQELAGQGGPCRGQPRDSRARWCWSRSIARTFRRLPRLLTLLRGAKRRCLLFCDDLSFDQQDTSYKSLKAVLEGGIEGRPDNVVLYATSNRRHLMSRDMIENERSTAINPGEAVEEKVSLSDRFGLWLGFHACDQETYHAMVARLCRALRPRPAARAAARRGRRMVDHPRRALRPRRLAVHPGSRRTARQGYRHRRLNPGAVPRVTPSR